MKNINNIKKKMPKWKKETNNCTEQGKTYEVNEWNFSCHVLACFISVLKGFYLDSRGLDN